MFVFLSNTRRTRICCNTYRQQIECILYIFYSVKIVPIDTTTCIQTYINIQILTYIHTYIYRILISKLLYMQYYKYMCIHTCIHRYVPYTKFILLHINTLKNRFLFSSKTSSPDGSEDILLIISFGKFSVRTVSFFRRRLQKKILTN